MVTGPPNALGKEWVVEEIRQGKEVENASIEVDIGLYEHLDADIQYVFQFIRTEDGAGTIYIPGRIGSTAEDKIATRDNKAKFIAAQAVAEETGTRAETIVMSQDYLNSVMRDSMDDLIGQIGEEEARRLLQEAANETDSEKDNDT